MFTRDYRDAFSTLAETPRPDNVPESHVAIVIWMQPCWQVVWSNPLEASDLVQSLQDIGLDARDSREMV